MKRKKKINNILVHLFLSVLAIIWVSPLFWIILTSFRAQKGAYTSSFFPKKYTFNNSKEIIYVFLTIFLYLLKCPQSLILSALRAFCFCGKPHISRSIFLYFRYQAWLKSW